jgi:hypothetical protein
MNSLKTKDHLNVLAMLLTALALLFGSVGGTSVFDHSGPAVVQVADGVAPSPPPPPPPPRGRGPARQA